MTEERRIIKKMTDKIKNMDIPRYGFVEKKQPEKIARMTAAEAMAKDFMEILGPDNA